MTQLFGFPIDTLTRTLLMITLAIVAVVVLLALSNAIFFKIGTRNIPRRRVQMALIVFALMLSTTLLSSVLATGDVITGAEQTVAVYNLGNVDETIQGGSGSLGFFPDGIYYNIAQRTRGNPAVGAVAAAMVETDLLVADETSRQVRSSVTGLGIIAPSEQGFGGMQAVGSKKHLTIASLQVNQVYLSQTLATLLNARKGDSLYLYSSRWPGQRYPVSVVNIVGNGGLVGDEPTMLANIQTFRRIEGQDDAITEIFIENGGGGGVNGVNLTNKVTNILNPMIPGDVGISAVKQQGVQSSQLADDIFSRVFTLFALFALAIGLLLIFLIFVLLAAERRVEMGMARAIGVQRRHIILMFLFEGTIYDFFASLIGLGIGVGAGALLVTYLGPILARFNFPLKLTLQPHSLIIAYCLGVIFTFCSVALSSWLISRMTVVEAIHDLPEPPRSTMSLGELCLRLWEMLRLLGSALIAPFTRKFHGTGQHGKIRVRRILFEHIPDLIVRMIGSLILLGFIPLLLGYWVMEIGLERAQIVYFSLGLTLIAIGGGLLIRSCFLSLLRNARNGKLVADRIFAAVAGLALLAYWALPFDVLAGLGLPRFQGGIEVFFVAASMMVLGAVWAIVSNAGLFVKPLLAAFARIPKLYTLGQLASAYPLHRRFRTGLSVIMFSMVVFAMTVMAIITNAMQNTYVNINSQTGGYDIQAIAFFKSIPDIYSALQQHGINPGDFSEIGVQTQTAVGVIQLSSQQPGWKVYPAQIISGGFLKGMGISLVARAQGFNSDAAVWQALQSNPHYALIDEDALPQRPDSVITPVYDPNAPLPADAGVPVQPPGLNAPNVAPYVFSLSGVYQGDTTFKATPLWVTSGVPAPDEQSSRLVYGTTSAVKLTIIGVVDNSDGNHFGLYIPKGAYQSSDPVYQQSPEAETYYFKVAPGQDKRALALKLGSAFLDNGLQTTVLADAIWQTRGPKILLSNVLLGVVALTLLLGVTALAITGTRAVVERRQQIGMLRALGCGRRMVQAAFLFESFLVGALGSILGVVLGLILSHNIFAANFFEQFNTGLTFSVPWQELALIVGIALLASFLGALLPAWQAGRVAPAEALRYQ
jgi:putative ABC transport system permease protein